MKKIIIILKSFLLMFCLYNYSYAVVTSAIPATASVLNEVSSSMSHSAVNPVSVTEDNQSVTSNIIQSADLKEDIKETAEQLDLVVDENTVEALSDSSSNSKSKQVAKEMANLQANINEKDEDYVMPIGPKTILYDSGWFELSKVDNASGNGLGSNGLEYSAANNVFSSSATHQARGKVYVNFDTDEMRADLFTKITLKGGTEVSHQWDSGAAGITEYPVVASTVRRLKPDGSTDFDEFVDVNSSMQVNSTTLASNYTCETGCFSKQELMDMYNHNTDDAAAEKAVFYFGQFTTVDANSLLGSGTIIVEGASHADPNANDAGTTAYIATIERLEGAGTIVGKPATSE